MNAPVEESRVRCEVSGADKLAPGSDDGGRICDIITAALAEQGQRSGFSVQARVRSPYHVSAKVTLADGRTLPEVNTASSDRALSDRSFRMLAKAILAQLTSAAH